MPMSSRESLLLRKVLIHRRFNDGSDGSLHELESETQPYLQLDALFGHDQLAVHTITADDQVIALPSRGERILSPKVRGDLVRATSGLLDSELVTASDSH